MREWLLTITGAALVGCAAMALAPEGPLKKSVRLVAGIVMTAAFLSCAADFDYAALSLNLAKYRAMAEDAVSGAVSAGSARERIIIEEEYAAYILDKARELGAEIGASVTVRWDDAGYWVPESVTVSGDVPDEVRRSLERTIETDLGVERSRQEWSAEDEG